MGKLNSNLYSPTLLPFERLRGARAMNALELTYGVKAGALLAEPLTALAVNVSGECLDIESLHDTIT
jgi:hypothetical protein